MRLPSIAAVVSLGLALASPCAAQSLTTLLSTGAPANRVDIVFLGDGYTADDLEAGAYTDDVEAYLGYLFGDAMGDPFGRYANFFNVHLVEVVSNESGADQPPNGVFRDTALDATYFSSGIERLLTVNSSKANTARNAALSGTGVSADMQYVVVNDTKYGGAGGQYAVFAGGNLRASELALHEVAHSFSNLADEYFTDGTTYAGGEPRERNATTDPSGAKWSHWIGFDDPRGANLDIGVFEGGRYYEEGLYRPSNNSKMRSLNQAFDAVSREKIILDIYSYVDPIDDYLPNDQSLIDPAALWIDVVDPAVIGVEWFVDGVLSTVDHGEVFDPIAEGLGVGVWSIEARAYDLALDATGDGSLLDLVRRDLQELEQRVAWSIELSVPTPVTGDYNGDGFVDAADYDVWRQAFGDTGPSPADGNADSLVDAADYTVWRDALAAAGLTPVPEPGGLWLCLMAATLLPTRRGSV